MTSNYANIQEFSFKKTNKKLKNRIVLAPLTHNMSEDNGDLSQHEIDWLKKCSEGGFGMLITAATSVSYSGRSWKGQPGLMNDVQKEGFAKIAKNAKSNNVITIVQLHHGGLRTDHHHSKYEPVSPSYYQADKYHPAGVRELNTHEIEELISDFVNSSIRAYDAGFDGVEIHAAFNFLLSNFSNPLLNRRKDKWGGTFYNRNKIIFDIVKRIRTKLPRDFIIGVRLSPENYAHYKGIEINEQIDLANELNRQDVDYIHMSLYDVFKKPNHLESTTQTLLQWIKAKLNPNITLIVAGNVSTIEEADKVISSGADLVAIGQAAIGNPDWVNKTLSGNKLVTTPYSINHLSEIGFTNQSIDYLQSISGLVTCDIPINNLQISGVVA